MSKRFAKYIDGVLILKVAQGDREAYAEIYQAYSSTVKNTIRQYIRDEDECNELTQQIFISLWERRALLSNVRSFDDYLFIMMRNRVFSYFSQLKREAMIMREMQQANTQLSPASQYSLELREYLSVWERAITLLPPQQKQVYNMIEKEELSVVSIAQELKLARGTVKKHLELARRSVRQFIDRHFETGRTTKATLMLLSFSLVDFTLFS